MCSVFVTCPKGLQYVLENELQGMGAVELIATPSGVSGNVDSTTLYRILLWSKLANRVILQLDSKKIDNIDDVYDLVMKIDWSIHFSEDNTFSVDFLGTNLIVNNSTFGALKVKDAVVDQFREKTGVRPSVDKTNPDIRISARLHKDRLSVGIDLSGESLHRRGYRASTGRAPLKENLAAGLLTLAGWPEKFDQNSSFIDPMCGSGTLLIEAAMLATNKAAGLDREKWGFDAWLLHDKKLWADLMSSANTLFEQGKKEFTGRIVGFDQDPRVISKAWENIRKSGLESVIHVEKRELAEFTLFEKMETGLLLSNPPYGERLGDVDDLKSLYQLMGEQFEQHLLSWRAGVFTGNIDLGKNIGWRSYKQYKLYNGAIESQLLLFDLRQENRFKEAWQSPEQRMHYPSYWQVANPERAQMFKNRIKKNFKSLAKWAKKNEVSCYRLYDADMPEFSLAIDLYSDENHIRWLHVQEYTAPKSIDEASSNERLREALAVLIGKDIDEVAVPINELLAIDQSRVVLKRRSIQKGSAQYEKNSTSGESLIVVENGARLNVNLKDYLDTGLFLDHRAIRRWIKDNAKGKRFLNLFSYTGAVTVSAALGGATESLSIDLSKTYLNWAQENFESNKLDLSKHKLKHQDCMEWLKAIQLSAKYDLIFLDPPSFSNSKRMQGVLDIQRDHVELIDLSMKKLESDGRLIFSNNLRKFKLDEGVGKKYQVTNLTKQSIDKDFERNQKIHQCWLIEHIN